MLDVLSGIELPVLPSHLPLELLAGSRARPGDALLAAGGDLTLGVQAGLRRNHCRANHRRPREYANDQRERSRRYRGYTRNRAGLYVPNPEPRERQGARHRSPLARIEEHFFARAVRRVAL